MLGVISDERCTLASAAALPLLPCDTPPSRPIHSAPHEHERVDHLARKPNYDFEKRRKEEERKKKKEEKRLRRQSSADNGADDQADGSEVVADEPASE